MVFANFINAIVYNGQRISRTMTEDCIPRTIGSVHCGFPTKDNLANPGKW